MQQIGHSRALLSITSYLYLQETEFVPGEQPHQSVLSKPSPPAGVSVPPDINMPLSVQRQKDLIPRLFFYKSSTTVTKETHTHTHAYTNIHAHTQSLLLNLKKSLKHWECELFFQEEPDALDVLSTIYSCCLGIDRGGGGDAAWEGTADY